VRENSSDSTLPRPTRFSLILQFATHATTTHTMRAVDYVTNGFGGQIQAIIVPPQVSPDVVLLQKAGLDSSFAPAFRATINQRGVAGIDQAIEFFSRYDQSILALSQMLQQNNWTLDGIRGKGKDVAYEVMRRAFNSVASQVGTNPLINAYTKASLTQVSQSQAQEYKFLLVFIGQYLTESLRRLRASL